MLNMDISKLSEIGKVTFCIMIAERAANYLQYKIIIEDVLKKCREWVGIKRKYDNGESVGFDFSAYCEDLADDLYNALDNEDNGFGILQEEEEDEQKINAWDCVIYSVGYVSKSAYLSAGAKYFPEPIELADENTVTLSAESLLKCSDEELESIRKIYDYCLNEKV